MKNILLLFLSLFFTANILLAETETFDAGSIVITTNNEDRGNVFVEEDIIKDYFSAGNNVSYSGIVEDLYLMGRKVTFNGKATGGMTAFAEKLEVNGDIESNFHGAAGTFKINGDINDTAFIAGEEIVISEGSTVDGAIFSASQTLHVMGKLNKGLYAAAGEVVIDGPVKGNVVAKTGKLIITERGSIDGNLEYSSGNTLSIAEENRISGTIDFVESKHVNKDDFSTFFSIVKSVFFLSLLIAGLLILLLPGIKSMVTENREAVSYWKTMLWGLIPVFIFPVLIIVTIPLLPVSIALGFSVLPLLGLTAVLGLSMGGKFLFKLFNWNKDNIYLQFLFACAIYSVLLFIPVIKAIACLGVTALGAGLITSKLFKTKF